MKPTDITTIHAATRYLAGVCDFAQRPDGVGYNMLDTAFGHSLAELPTLTPAQAGAACKMLRKYSKQLSEVGITLPEAVDPDVPEISISGSAIYLAFGGKPSDNMRAWVKSINGWRWNPDREDKAWSVPLTANNLATVNAKFSTAFAMPENQPVQQQHPAAAKLQLASSSKADVVIEVAKGALLVSFPNPSTRKAHVEKVKSLQERKWLPDEPGMPWRVPSRFASQIAEWFPNAKGIEKISAIVEQESTLRQMSNQAAGSSLVINGLKGELYPFQRVGVEFVEVAQGRAIVGDEPGLGKTIQAIGYLQLHPELRPAVVICPASLKANWKREIERWTTDNNRVFVVGGTKTYDLSAAGADILIVNWDILSAWQDEIIKFAPAVVIADEAHYAKNKTAKRSKAAKEIAKKISKVILLTGTPITNRPAELFPLLNMIAPKAWSNWWKFAERYCAAYNNGFGWDFSGASNLDELHQAIGPYMIRRKKEQVLTDLPAKRWVNVVVDFDPAVQAEYDKAVAKAEQEVAQMPRAAQLALIERMKQIAVKAKLPGVIAWVKEFIETGEKLVLFATHHETIHALQAEFGEVAVTVTGETAMKDRQGAVDRFQTDDNIRLFLGNIQAAGVGLTLTAASNVAFVEFPWTSGDLSQASDRVHRIGQKESVTVWSLVADGTIDIDITELLEAKRQVVENVTDGQVSTGSEIGLVNEIIDRIVSKKKG